MTTRHPRTDTPALGADGEFCWMDIKTRDITGTAAFFSAVLGWHFAVDDNDWRQATVITVDDHRIGTLSDLNAGIYPPGTPPHVAPYLAVDDVDGRVAAAVAGGAQLIVPPFDAADQGRIATLIDPFGAPVSLWCPAEGLGWRHPPGVPAAPYRMLLSCPQPAEARHFYQKALGAGLHHADVIPAVDDSAEPARWELVVTVENLDVVTGRATGSGIGLVTPVTRQPSLPALQQLSTIEGVAVYVSALPSTATGGDARSGKRAERR